MIGARKTGGDLRLAWPSTLGQRTGVAHSEPVPRDKQAPGRIRGINVPACLVVLRGPAALGRPRPGNLFCLLPGDCTDRDQPIGLVAGESDLVAAGEHKPAVRDAGLDELERRVAEPGVAKHEPLRDRLGCGGSFPMARSARGPR
jgi:hypothetical protein